MVRTSLASSRPLAKLLALGVAALALTIPETAAQGFIAPPRGLLGPGSGGAAGGGPGDRNDTLVTDSAAWTRWWAFNREPYLVRIRAPFALPVSAAPLDGVPLQPNPSRPADETLYLEVVPAIRAHLESTRDLDLLAASLLALGKIGEAPSDLAKKHELPSSADAILEHFGESNVFLRGIAVTSLGLLGDAAHAPVLAAIALDTKDGRAAVRNRKLERRTRAAATYALAYIGMTTPRRSERSLVVHHLLALADAERKDTDLLTAAVIGLGWNPLPLSAAPTEDAPLQGRESALAFLHELFDDSKADARGRTQVPVAIARLILAPTEILEVDAATDAAVRQQELRERAVTRFTRAIQERGGERRINVREGCIQALGLLIKDRPVEPDTSATDALLKVVENGQERDAGLALVALGRIAGRGTGAQGSRTRALRRVLSETVSTGSPSRRPWALLAIGIAEDRARAAGAAPALGTQALVELRLEKAPSPQESAAAAISLGLSDAGGTAEKVASGLRNGDFYVRGLRALSLALMGAREFTAHLQVIAMERTYRPYLLRDVATALALLGDPALVDILITKLAFARFMPERVAALSAMAWCDDPAAIAALLFIVNEKRMGTRKIDDTSRAFAVTALGTLCGQSALPWNTRFALDVTWSAAPPTLTSPLNGGGVLDIL